MSAFGGKADLVQTCHDDAYSKAEIKHRLMIQTSTVLAAPDAHSHTNLCHFVA